MNFADQDKCEMGEKGLSDDILLGLYRERERYIAVAFRYLQDREKARDVFSDSYAYVLEHRHTLTGDLTKMKIYLMQTVKHKCLDAMRHDDAARKACANLYENSIRMLPGDNITQNVIRQDIYALIRDTGNKISRRTLDIYVSRKFHGLSHKELAGRFGITRSRVAKEISKAGKVIDEIIRRYFHSGSEQ